MSDETKLLQDKVDVLGNEIKILKDKADEFITLLKLKNEEIEALKKDKETLVKTNLAYQNRAEELIKQNSEANLVIHNADKAMVEVKEILEVHPDSLPSDKKEILQAGYNKYKQKMDTYTYSERQPIDEETLKQALEAEAKEQEKVGK